MNRENTPPVASSQYPAVRWQARGRDELQHSGEEPPGRDRPHRVSRYQRPPERHASHREAHPPFEEHGPGRERQSRHPERGGDRPAAVQQRVDTERDDQQVQGQVRPEENRESEQHRERAANAHHPPVPAERREQDHVGR